MNLELCKFPCVHLIRFRLVQKQAATVKAHTCALSWHSPFNDLASYDALLWKYVDDTMISEVVPKGQSSNV